MEIGDDAWGKRGGMAELNACDEYEVGKSQRQRQSLNRYRRRAFSFTFRTYAFESATSSPGVAWTDGALTFV